MSWNVYYRLLRETPAEPAELDALARHSRQVHKALHDYDLILSTEARTDQVLAHGHVERYYDPDDADVRTLLDALTALRGIVDRATLEVWDDLELIGWSARSAAFDFMGQSDVQRFSPPSPGDSLVRVSDLSDDHEFGADAWAARPVTVPTQGPTQAEAFLTFTEPPDFRIISDRYTRTLSVQGWLHNPHGVMVTLDDVQLIMRDGAGAAVDAIETGLHQLAAELQFLACRLEVAPGTTSAARFADIVLAYSYDAAQPLFRATVPPFQTKRDERYRAPLPLEDAPVTAGALPLTTAVRAWHGHDYEGYVQVIIEVHPEFDATGVSARVRLLCQDEAGLALGAGEDRVEFPTGRGPAVASIQVCMPRRRVAHVRRLELDIEASRDIRTSMGRYALDLPG